MKPMSHHETADGYARTIANINADWRVIVCRGNHQWIAQHVKKSRAGRRWQAVRFFRTKNALIQFVTASCGEIDPTARAILDSLPEFFGGRTT